MPSHRFHPNLEAGEKPAVLYDNCERCAEHAKDPFVSLDQGRISRLLDIATMEVEATTEMELAAAGTIMEAVVKYNMLVICNREALVKLAVRLEEMRASQERLVQEEFSRILGAAETTTEEGE